MPRPSQTGLSHIEAAHAIPELKPRMVADAVGTSLRTLQGVFAESENPFPWMSEAMDLKKEKNFFETRVIEYQNGAALSWD